MAKKSMLDDGITSSGQMSRGFDKYGKRLHRGEPVKDKSKKDRRISGFSKGVSSPKAADSDTPRSKSF